MQINFSFFYLSYDDAYKYAEEIGNILSNAYQSNISAAVLPNEKMYFNIADRIINPTMQTAYDYTSMIAERIQEQLNADASIGINAIVPDMNQDRVNGIINRISNEDNFGDIDWILDEPIKNFIMSIVDDSIRENSEFQWKSGMTPGIIRKLAGECCDWCADVAGQYSYPGVPKDVFKRHERCRCTVEYHTGNGKVQNSHSKKWRNETESDKIIKRSQVAPVQRIQNPKALEQKLEEQQGLAYRISENPKMLQAYTPGGLKKALENLGYDVKPLGAGNYKGISFEDGGGFRISYGGDRYLQYHPEKRSHHGEAYYKTSSGKEGTHRYNMKGEEVDEYGRVKNQTKRKT